MSRYIDADALKHCIEIEVGLNPNQDGFLYDDVVNEIIEQQPTADVREVVHGEWLISELGFPYCSKCGTALTKSAPRTNYCSNCGAKMRGETDEQIH